MSLSTGSEKQAVRETLRFREPTTLPIDLGSTRSTGINAIAYARLVDALGLPKRAIRVFDVRQYLCLVDEDVTTWAGSAFEPLYPRVVAAGLPIEEWKPGKMPGLDKCLVPASFAPVIREDGAAEIVTEAGTATHRRPAGGLYFEDINPPLSGVESPDDLDRLPSEPQSELDREWMARESSRLRQTGRAVVATTPFSFFERGIKDFGYEEWLVRIMTDKKLTRAYMERLYESFDSFADAHADSWQHSADVVLITDDLGTQESLLLPPDIYRESIFPFHKRLVSRIKSALPDVKVLLHSCGAVRSLIPDFIEAGFDALNPVQLSATGMDPVELKREYGRDITFWGGGINTQDTLVNGSPLDVRDEALRMVDTFAPGGGFIFATVHNIQADVPTENIVALFEAVRK